MATITLPSGSTSNDLQIAISGAASGDIIELSSDMDFLGTVTVPASLLITIRSTTGAWILTMTVMVRHFIVEGSLILENIVLDGAYASRGAIGGGIYVSGGALVMNAGAVIRNCAVSTIGGGIYLENGTFTMNDGEISDNHETTTFGGSGGGVYMINSTFTMNDGIITNNSAVWGGGIDVGQECTFTMNGGEISNNSATTQYGGGVHVYVHGIFIMNDGTISGNKATYVASATTFTGGVGGGVFVGQGSYVAGEPTDWCRFIMNGGSIENNEAYQGGGGVGASWIGQIEMYGGSISDNYALNGGGVALTNPRAGGGGISFTMIGGEIANNVTPTTNAAYGYGGGIYASANNSTYENLIIEIEDAAGTAGSTPLIYGNSSRFGGGMYLYGVKTNATIYDGYIYKNSGFYGGGIHLSYTAKLTMSGGVIGADDSANGNTARYEGGGIYSTGSTTSYSVFTMTGGKISGNTANTTSGYGGGGIYMSSLSYSITGGEIIGNISQLRSGGGLYIAQYTAALDPISNTRIENNTAAVNGGGVYIANSVSFENVTIENNTAAADGGGIYIGTVTASAISITNTSITNNEATRFGGGMYVWSTLAAGVAPTVENSVISNNSAGSGGGVYVTAAGSLTATGLTSFTNNTAKDYGGGIYTEDYDYSNPASTAAYQNIKTSPSTIFSGNLASQAYFPPDNASDFVNIGYATTSIATSSGYIHPLNNYDINYVGQMPFELFSVIYNANGGTGSHTDADILSGTVYDVLSPEEAGISRPGYTFTGWNTSPDGTGTYVHSVDTFVVTGNVVLYAQWTRIEGPYDVIYNANGGSGSHSDTGIPGGTVYTVLSPEAAGISRPGYTFAGWNTASDGSAAAYLPGDTIVITGNVVLYAQWVPIQGLFQVTYCPNCPASCNNECYTDAGISGGTVYTILSPEDTGISCPCHMFTGWNTQPDGSGTTYQPGDNIVINENVTLYAQWTPNRIPGNPCCCKCRPCCNRCCCKCRPCRPPQIIGHSNIM